MTVFFHSRMLIIGFSLILSGEFIAISDATANEPDFDVQENGIKWGENVGGAACALTTDQTSTEYVIGKPIVVKFHLKNTSSKKIWLYSSGISGSFKYQVIGPNKKQVSTTLFGTDQSSPIRSGPSFLIPVEPKSAIKQVSTFWLNNDFDMTLPGIYSITFKRLVSVPGKKEWIYIKSNTLLIKVIESSKTGSDNSLKVGSKKVKIKWGKPVEGISCAMSTNMKKNSFQYAKPVWVNFHIKKNNSKLLKFNGLEGEYEISVLAPYQRNTFNTQMNKPVSTVIYTTDKLHPMPLTLYGLQETKGESKSILHIRLKPNAKQDFIRLNLNRYFDMTMLPKKGYQVSFRRKLKLPKQIKAITIQSNTLVISNMGISKPKK